VRGSGIRYCEPGTTSSNTRDNTINAQMRYRAMDRNNDGAISRSEWTGTREAFVVSDWNGDNVLSGDEVRPGAQRARNREERDFDPNRGRRFDDWTAEAFAELDHNRDGRLTTEEWHYDREAWLRADRDRDNVLTRAEFLGDAAMDLDREDRFDDLDANNNGRIERSEWHGTAEGFAWLDRDSDGRLSRTEMLGEETTREADLFASLDMNRDGRLAQNEWHWSRRSFLQQDANRDGVVSRAEFSNPVAATTGGTIGTSGRTRELTVDVNSQERWVDTGIDVLAGDTVAIRSDGTIRLSSNWSDTAGAAGANRRAANAPMPNHPAGALIARVGAGAPIFIGDSTGARNVTTGGRLYLSVNDDYLADNVGSLRVTISVSR
jgi:Ca2+-binding EF-hand superfamily protein